MPLATALRNVLSALLPSPQGPLMADPTAPQMIGDLMDADDLAVSTQAAAAAAAAAADKALTDANTTLTTSDAALAAGLLKVGPSYKIDASNVVSVYVSDTGPRGFHKFNPAPVTTALPADPAPAPAPTPEPAPEPAPAPVPSA